MNNGRWIRWALALPVSFGLALAVPVTALAQHKTKDGEIVIISDQVKGDSTEVERPEGSDHGEYKKRKKVKRVKAQKAKKAKIKKIKAKKGKKVKKVKKMKRSDRPEQSDPEITPPDIDTDGADEG